MNPSASGWIKKFGEFVKPLKPIKLSLRDLYNILREHRFVYGYSSSSMSKNFLKMKLRSLTY